MLLADIWPIKQQDPVLGIIGIGSTGSETTDNLADYKRMRLIAEYYVWCSQREVSRYKNIPRNRRKVLNADGCGKDQEEGLRVWNEKLPLAVDDTRAMLEKYNIKHPLFIHALGGGSGIGAVLLASALIEEGFVKHAPLLSIASSFREDPQIIANSVQSLKEIALKLDTGQLTFAILAQVGKIAHNDSGDFKKTDKNIARVLEMTGRSCVTSGNLDVSDLNGYILSAKSPKDRFGTLGYEGKLLNKHNKNFASEVIQDMTTRVIESNWVGADLSKKCRVCLFVIRADPQYINENNKNIIQNAAHEILPKSTGIHVSTYPVSRAHTIEISAIFSGISTDIMSRYQQILEETETNTDESDESESGTAWQALGFDQNPYMTQEAGV